MSSNCQQGDTRADIKTVQDLLERYPALRKRDGSGRSIIEMLAECGYRLQDLEDIIRAQNGDFTDLQACLSCRVTKIIYCI
jgi:hypothetical protein